MALKDNYGLPDSTLQLIGSSPELNFGRGPNDAGLTSMISALRGERSSNNPGVRLLANRANGAGINFNRKPTSTSNAVPILKMAKVPKTETTLPVGETQTPYVRPDTPFVPDLIYPDVIDFPDEPDVPDEPDTPDDPDVPDDVPDVPDVPDMPDEPSDPDPEDPLPSIYTKPIESDIPDEIDPDTIPLIDAPDILETIPGIYTDPIVTDIPDEIDPGSIPFITPEFPLELPEIPEIAEKVDKSYWDDPNTPEEVGPNRAGGGDLPEDFDQYLAEIANSFNGGTNGGGKYFDDQSAATMAFAKGGKVTPDRLAGPNPAGPDDGFAALKNGEFVLNKEAAEAIGYELLNRLNRSRP